MSCSSARRIASMMSRREMKTKKYFLTLGIDKRNIICYNVIAFDGRLAQLGEHLPYKQRVTGSSPVLSTIGLLSLSSEWLGSSVG